MLDRRGSPAAGRLFRTCATSHSLRLLVDELQVDMSAAGAGNVNHFDAVIPASDLHLVPFVRAGKLANGAGLLHETRFGGPQDSG